MIFRLRVLYLFVFLGCSTVFAAPDRNFNTTPLMASETRALVQMVECYHYNRDAVNNADYSELIADYTKQLDPEKLFFTIQDETALKNQYASHLQTDLVYLGNIDSAFAIFRLYEKRVLARSMWIFDRLKGNFDFTPKDSFVFNRNGSAWPASNCDADTLWEMRLKYQLIPFLLDGKTIDDAKASVRKNYERFVKNVSEIEASEIQEMFLTSLTQMYDPHSTFFSADTLEDFSIQMRLSFVGIGLMLTLDDDGNCVVEDVIPGGPANISRKIKINDKIMAVCQSGEEPVEVTGMKLRHIVDLIRGRKGTQVALSIIPATTGRDSVATKNVVIVRDNVKLSSQRATAQIYSVPNGAGEIQPVGVITFNVFYGLDETSPKGLQSGLTKDVTELIKKLQNKNIKGLVIDLRCNGGGLLSEAIDLSGLFIGKGPIVQVRNSRGEVTIDSSANTKIKYDGPLAVLTSRFSASASEIFAGAMQNYGRAIIVGESSTHGKGTVQAVLEIKNFLPFLSKNSANRVGAVKLTFQKFYLPNGSSTQDKGVTPDITLPSIDDYLPSVGESQLPHALLWDNIDSAPFIGKPLEPAFLSPLVQASRNRQQHLPEFIHLNGSVEHFKAEIERKTTSLNLDKRRSEMEDIKKFDKKVNDAFCKLTKNNFVHYEVKLDSVIDSEAAGKKPTPTLDRSNTDDTDSKLDVHLREALRVVVDAKELAKDPKILGQP